VIGLAAGPSRAGPTQRARRQDGPGLPSPHAMAAGAGRYAMHRQAGRFPQDGSDAVRRGSAASDA